MSGQFDFLGKSGEFLLHSNILLSNLNQNGVFEDLKLSLVHCDDLLVYFFLPLVDPELALSRRVGLALNHHSDGDSLPEHQLG